MMANLVLYALIGAALLGSALGVFVQKWLFAVLAAALLAAIPMGLLIALSGFITANETLSTPTREALTDLADPTVLLQMTIACAGGALLAGLLSRVAGAGQTASPAKPRATARKRVAAVADRTPMQDRASRVTAHRAPVANAEPPPVYDIAPGPGGQISASSVGDIVRDADNAEGANRRDRGRRRAILAGFLLMDEDRSSPCRIVDLSDTGARVRLPTMMPLPDKLCLLNTSGWMAYDVELAWRSDLDAGLQFLSKRDLRNPVTERDKALHALCVDLTAR